MISSLGNRQISFYARTGFVLDNSEVSASTVLDRAPSADGYFQITISGGTTGSGTVTVTGTDVSGSAQSETITFTANGIAQTTKRWKASASATVTTSGLADEATPPQISIESIDASGQLQLVRKTLASARVCRLSYVGRLKWPSPVQGSQEQGSAWIYVDYEEVWTPPVGGIARDDSNGNEWLITGVEALEPGASFASSGWRLACRVLNP